MISRFQNTPSGLPELAEAPRAVAITENGDANVVTRKVAAFAAAALAALAAAQSARAGDADGGHVEGSTDAGTREGADGGVVVPAQKEEDPEAVSQSALDVVPPEQVGVDVIAGFFTVFIAPEGEENDPSARRKVSKGVPADIKESTGLFLVIDCKDKILPRNCIAEVAGKNAPVFMKAFGDLRRFTLPLRYVYGKEVRLRNGRKEIGRFDVVPPAELETPLIAVTSPVPVPIPVAAGGSPSAPAAPTAAAAPAEPAAAAPPQAETVVAMDPIDLGVHGAFYGQVAASVHASRGGLMEPVGVNVRAGYEHPFGDSDEDLAVGVNATAMPFSAPLKSGDGFVASPGKKVDGSAVNVSVEGTVRKNVVERRFGLEGSAGIGPTLWEFNGREGVGVQESDPRQLADVERVSATSLDGFIAARVRAALGDTFSIQVGARGTAPLTHNNNPRNVFVDIGLGGRL